eukprot:TRINITY_DN12076_c0_g2_i1.p1 TRINITY_DN12076_c0_g2~~TRINITY_DN12076_c0_g2_i1.p1  ORF type:complete len:1644 (+),score=290.71 TRINITY_DN12076_c0_g2_i1:202-5133(+)
MDGNGIDVKSPKAVAAQVDYLLKHKLADVIDRALGEILRDLPEDPIPAFVERLRVNAELKVAADERERRRRAASAVSAMAAEQRSREEDEDLLHDTVRQFAQARGLDDAVRATLSALMRTKPGEVRERLRDWFKKEDASHGVPSPTGKAATSPQKKKKKQKKWGDGLVDEKSVLSVARAAVFYPAAYKPEADYKGAISGIAQWCVPEGIPWPKSSVDELMHGARMMSLLHCDRGRSDDTAAASIVYSYSAQLLHPEVWAFWNSTTRRWRRLRSWRMLEGKASAQKPLALHPMVASEMGVQFGFLTAAVLQPALDLPCGLTCWTANQDALVRYSNALGGSQLSPLKDSVLWLPSFYDLLSKDASRTFSQNPPGQYPYPGVWERVASRCATESLCGNAGTRQRAGTLNFDDVKQSATPPAADAKRVSAASIKTLPAEGQGSLALIQSMFRDEDWTSCGYGNAELDELVAECLSLKNQQLEAPHLSETAVRISLQDQVFAKIFDRKMGSSDSTPCNLARACTVQNIDWFGTKWVAALTEKPRVIYHCESERTSEIWRTYACTADQPYALVNESMRNLHSGSLRTSLTVRESPHTPSGEYIAVDTVELMLRECAKQARRVAVVESSPTEEEFSGLSIESRRQSIRCASKLVMAARTPLKELRRWKNDKRRISVPRVPRPTGDGDASSIAGRVDCLQGCIRAALHAGKATMDPGPLERLQNVSLDKFERRCFPVEQLHGDPCLFLLLRMPTEGSAVEESEYVIGRRSDEWVVFNWCPVGEEWSPDLDAVLLQENVTVQRGTYVLPVVRPFIYYLQQFLSARHYPLPDKETSERFYRGITGVVVSAIAGYDEGRLVRWPAFSSSSSDQGVACSFAQGKGSATVFTVDGKSCRRISRHSRFCREEEWLFPCNTNMHVRRLLSAEQQEVLGKAGLQIVELSELTNREAQRTLIRSLLVHAQTAAAAAVVFRAEAAAVGDGVLDLSLKYPFEGSTAQQFQVNVIVHHNLSGQCPDKLLEHGTAWRAGGKSSAWHDLQPDLQGLAWEVCYREVGRPSERADGTPRNSEHTCKGESPFRADVAAGLLGLREMPSNVICTVSPRRDGPGFHLHLQAPATKFEVGVGLRWQSDTPFMNAKLKKIAAKGYYGEIVSTAGSSVTVRWSKNPGDKIKGDTTISRKYCETSTVFAVGSGWSATATARLTPARAGQALGLPGAQTLRGVLELGVPIRNVAVANNSIGHQGAEELLAGLKSCPHCLELSLGASADIQAHVRRAVAMRCALHGCADDGALPFELFEMHSWGSAAAHGLAGARRFALPWDRLNRDSDRAEASVLLSQQMEMCRNGVAAPADALHLVAISSGTTEALSAAAGTLASSGARLSDLEPALLLAARHGTPEAALALLGLLADPTRARDSRGLPAVSVAARNPLFTNESDAGETALHKLAAGDCLNTVFGSDGTHSLYAALADMHIEAATVLLDLGADVFVRTKARETALHAWVCLDDSEESEYLLTRLVGEHGENVNAKDGFDSTPLMRAAECGNVFAVEGLLAAGADCHLSDGDGDSALHLAAWEGHKACAQSLLQHGADARLKGGAREDTPLHNACRRGHSDCVRLLVEHLTQVVQEGLPLEVAPLDTTLRHRSSLLCRRGLLSAR